MGQESAEFGGRFPALSGSDFGVQEKGPKHIETLRGWQQSLYSLF